MMDELKTYPYFIPCTQQQWEQYNQAATALILELHGSEGGDNYSSPFIDHNGQHYFMVNAEIEEVIPAEDREGVNYEEITFTNE